MKSNKLIDYKRAGAMSHTCSNWPKLSRFSSTSKTQKQIALDWICPHFLVSSHPRRRINSSRPKFSYFPAHLFRRRTTCLTIIIIELSFWVLTRQRDCGNYFRRGMRQIMGLYWIWLYWHISQCGPSRQILTSIYHLLWNFVRSLAWSVKCLDHLHAYLLCKIT